MEAYSRSTLRQGAPFSSGQTSQFCSFVQVSGLFAVIRHDRGVVRDDPSGVTAGISAESVGPELRVHGVHLVVVAGVPADRSPRVSALGFNKRELSTWIPGCVRATAAVVVP